MGVFIDTTDNLLS